MKWINVVLAILLLLCLLPLPYGYYTLVRFVSMIGFAVLGFSHLEQGEKNLAMIFGGLALLFQPFVKIVLGRGLWNVVDVAVAIFLLVLLFHRKKAE